MEKGDYGPKRILHNYGGNGNLLRAPQAETSTGKITTKVEARRAMLRAYRFFKKQPGLENLGSDWVSPQVSIRETVMIKGKKTVTVEDYKTGKFYDGAVCYAFYLIDEHINDGMGFNARHLGYHVPPTILRGALLPEGSRFLIVTDRCLFSDREVNRAFRVECPCFAIGHAARAKAVLSARTKWDPEELPLKDVCALLSEHGKIIPGDVTLAPQGSVRHTFRIRVDDDLLVYLDGDRSL